MKIKLKNSEVTIELNDVGLSPQVINGNGKYFSLYYSGVVNGFFLNTKAIWLEEEDFDEYIEEFNLYKELCKEANEIIWK